METPKVITVYNEQDLNDALKEIPRESGIGDNFMYQYPDIKIKFGLKEVVNRNYPFLFESNGLFILIDSRGKIDYSCVEKALESFGIEYTDIRFKRESSSNIEKTNGIPKIFFAHDLEMLGNRIQISKEGKRTYPWSYFPNQKGSIDMGYYPNGAGRTSISRLEIGAMIAHENDLIALLKVDQELSRGNVLGMFEEKGIKPYVIVNEAPKTATKLFRQ